MGHDVSSRTTKWNLRMYIDLRHETLTSRNLTCVSIFVCGLSSWGPLKNLIVETFLGDAIKINKSTTQRFRDDIFLFISLQNSKKIRQRLK